MSSLLLLTNALQPSTEVLPALGLLTVVIAGVLGTAGAFAVQTYVMHAGWKFDADVLVAVTALCLALTLGAGLLGTWRALRQKPAPYLRNL